ncbi:DNA-binding transcriptional activator CaiF [Leminorella richardii]|uniref:DNA-binding transcriptional activator CaiF n=1 Tax=Leminorella richardii TaxID=158841 RepID=A0A2X4XQP0_9GAMM|nr:carnitine metabolism transcriptional regulator CaiF [Leminorella richardii]SQI42255.1 DNA-binding transcriptional activator CaiF [Leminorella richardii]
MYRECVQEPLYLSVARWIMQQKRWVSATEIAEHFELTTCKAINTVSYILSEVDEIVCKTKSVPNQLAGRGCQCQRLIQVDKIDELISSRIKNAVNAESDAEDRLEQVGRVPPSELNREQKWQWMLSKGQRK